MTFFFFLSKYIVCLRFAFVNVKRTICIQKCPTSNAHHGSEQLGVNTTSAHTRGRPKSPGNFMTTRTSCLKRWFQPQFIYTKATQYVGNLLQYQHVQNTYHREPLELQQTILCLMFHPFALCVTIYLANLMELYCPRWPLPVKMLVAEVSDLHLSTHAGKHTE